MFRFNPTRITSRFNRWLYIILSTRLRISQLAEEAKDSGKQIQLLMMKKCTRNSNLPFMTTKDAPKDAARPMGKYDIDQPTSANSYAHRWLHLFVQLTVILTYYNVVKISWSLWPWICRTPSIHWHIKLDTIESVVTYITHVEGASLEQRNQIISRITRQESYNAH